MSGSGTDHFDGTVLAQEAATELFNDRSSDAVAIYEPKNSREAAAAVRVFGEMFDRLPGKISSALEDARESGSLLSGDRFQGLAEIIQNADDAGASEIRMVMRPADLLVTHNGEPVRLHNVLGFAIPWLSTKGGETTTTGRFGIGLMTLRSLSTTIEVHCPPFHVQLGDPTISPIERLKLPESFEDDGWTTLRIPLEEGVASPKEVEAWLGDWDDAGLLFLRHVRRIVLLSLEGATIRELAVSRHAAGELVVDESPKKRVVSRERVETSEGRSWLVYRGDAMSPPGVVRARKATGLTTPVSVAFSLHSSSSGELYAGLPVSTTRMSLFASAQFDPLTNRTGFAGTDWNRALVPVVAELWSQAAVDLFRRSPKEAWHSMPTAELSEGFTDSWIVDSLEKEVDARASQWLASRLSFNVPGQGDVRLKQLAVEEQPLEEILSESEVCKLAHLPATLPARIRDRTGKWRAVLEGWRLAGANLPMPVSVEDALSLLYDETRSIDSTVALVAAALGENLDERLLALPCVIDRDGRRLVPPTGDSPLAIAEQASLLAEQLGIVTLLNDVYHSDNLAARTVLSWLNECGALIDGSDNRAVLRRLASAGKSRRTMVTPLTDEQARALREAFELLDVADRRELGPDVGRAILLEAYTFDGKRQRTMNVRPVDAYLPRAIDRGPDSFPRAAGQTPGLVWLSDKYDEVLRSPIGRRGVGAQRFLRLLGTEIVPRIRSHPGLQQRYSGSRKGLPKSVAQGPEARKRAMEERTATYTLGDFDSPDLKAVAEDISRERLRRRRRERAAALLSSLSRAWERQLTEFAEVDSASDYMQWQLKDPIAAFWLWEVGEIAWLDDESGRTRRPMDLMVRTQGNVAIYGDSSREYLHKDLCGSNLSAVLSAIRVSGDPNRSELTNRLRRLRDGDIGEDEQLSTSSLAQEVAVIYKALAHDFESPASRSDLSIAQVREEFQRGEGLVHTNVGWLPPASVFAGPKVFGGYAAFAPSVEGTEPLWRRLNLRNPSSADCIKVINRIARKRNGPSDDDRTILLETFRLLASSYEDGNSVPLPRMRRLALWTNRGWARERPVYVTDDPVLAEGLKDRIALWEPGGDLSQFRSLLGPLDIEEIRTENADVIDPDLSFDDPDATKLFRSALTVLRDDLARNDPELAGGLRVFWDTLHDFTVRVHPSLFLKVHLGTDESSQGYATAADARVDRNRQAVFIRDWKALARVDGVGRALAALFEGNTRSVAQAWLAAWDRAEENFQARPIELAQQQASRDKERVEQQLANRITAFSERTSANRAEFKESATPQSTTKASIGRNDGTPRAIELGPLRKLVDPNSLRIVDRRGRIETGTPSTQQQSRHVGSLREPTDDSSPPRNRTPLQGFSSLDRENLGVALVRKLLSSDDDQIVDLRTQRGVGADAVDSMRRFYELKVSSGAEPDYVSLTHSEFQRAMRDPDFFLIVVSEIEGAAARPKIRVLLDPLRQLRMSSNSTMTLSGVRSAEKSLVYDFEPTDEADSSTEKEDDRSS